MPDPIKGEVIACFITLKPGFKGSKELEEELKSLVVKSLGKPFKPEKIYFIKDLPRTRSGKIMRRVIRAIVLDQEIGELSVLENPDSIEDIRKALGKAKS